MWEIFVALEYLNFKHTSLKKYINWAKLIYFSLVLREREEKKQNLSHPSYQRKTSSDKQYGCIGEQFTEIFLKKFSNVQLVLDTLQEYDFKVRRPAIKFLTNLLVNKPRLMQQIVLQSEMGVSRQGPLKKWTEHSQKLHLLKIHSRGAPITPWGWMGVDSLDHKLW